MRWRSRWRNDPSTRETAAGRAYLDVQNRPRAEGRGTQQLLTLHVVERWLAMLSISRYADQFVLNGGMFLAAFGARRPTADADALARHSSSDEARVVEIANEPLPEDGVEFRIATVTSRVIRDENFHSGVRIGIDCALVGSGIGPSSDRQLRDRRSRGSQLRRRPGRADAAMRRAWIEPRD